MEVPQRLHVYSVQPAKPSRITQSDAQHDQAHDIRPTGQQFSSSPLLSTILVVMAGFCIFTFIVHSSISEALVWPNTALQHPSGKIAEQPCLMHSGHKITEVRGGGGGEEKAPIPLPQGVAVRTPLSNIWTHMKLEKRMSVD